MNSTTVGRAMEILLVEDNLEDARVTIQALKHENVRCRISLVCDGEEALSFLRRQGVFARTPQPDLILLDMELPKKGGIDVLAEIRGDEHLKAIPVLVLSASAVHRAILDARKLNIDGFMTKPVSLEQFVSAVKLLRRSWLVEMALSPRLAQG